MSRSSRPRRSYPGTVCALLVALVQLTALTWVPVAHAEKIDDTGHPTVENAHSSDCSEIHVESRCTVCAATHHAWPTQRRREMDGPIVAARCAITAREVPAFLSAPTYPARASPSS